MKESDLTTDFLCSLFRAAQSVKTKNLRQFEDLNLTVSQAAMLYYLAHADSDKPAHPKDLETAFGTTHASVSRTVRNLMAKGYVRTEGNHLDYRMRDIHISKKGLSVVPELNCRMNSVLEAVSEKYSELELASLSALLRRL